MITVKNEREIKLLRKAGHIVALVHQAMAKAIAPGVTTMQLNDIAEEIILSNGAYPSFKGYQGFPCAICASINEELVHGIPSNRVLKEGDIISIDVGANYQGYHGDSAWTYPVGKIAPQYVKLLEETKECLFKGLSEVKEMARIGDISHAIEQHALQFGYGIPEDYTGHGIGAQLHEDPYIPNYGPKNVGPWLKANMVLAIEPMIQEGSKRTRVLKNGWTVVSADGKRSAHFEHTVLVTKTGYEILTKIQED